MPDQPSIGQLDFAAVRCLDVSLAEKLEAYVRLHREHQPEVAKIYQDLVDRLTAGGAGQNAPGIGDRLVPMCEANALGARERYYADLKSRTRASGSRASA